MTSIKIKARKWRVLSMPLAIAIGGMYFTGAWSAWSFHPENVFNEIVSQGYSLIILIIAVALYLFLEFADGRLIELAINDVSIQAIYYHEESKWIDWDDIQSVKKTFTKLKIADKFDTKISIPLLKFTASDRQRIKNYLQQNINTAR